MSDGLKNYYQKQENELIINKEAEIKQAELLQTAELHERELIARSYSQAKEQAEKYGWDNLVYDETLKGYRLKSEDEGFDATKSPELQLTLAAVDAETAAKDSRLLLQNAEKNYDQKVSDMLDWEMNVNELIGRLPAEFKSNNIKDITYNLKDTTHIENMNIINKAKLNAQRNEEQYKGLYFLVKDQDRFFKENYGDYAGIDELMNTDEFQELVKNYKLSQGTDYQLRDSHGDLMFDNDDNPILGKNFETGLDVPRLKDLYADKRFSQSHHDTKQKRKSLESEFLSVAEADFATIKATIQSFMSEDSDYTLEEVFGEKMAPFMINVSKMVNAEALNWYLRQDPTGEIAKALEINPNTNANYASYSYNIDNLNHLRSEWVESKTELNVRTLKFRENIDNIDINDKDAQMNAFKLYTDNQGFFTTNQEMEDNFTYMEDHFGVDLGPDFTQHLMGPVVKATDLSLEHLSEMSNFPHAYSDKYYDDKTGEFKIDAIWQLLYNRPISESEGADELGLGGYFLSSGRQWLSNDIPDNVPFVSPMKKDFQMRDFIGSLSGTDKKPRPHYNAATAWTIYGVSARNEGVGGFRIFQTAYANNEYFNHMYDGFRESASEWLDRTGYDVPGMFFDSKSVGAQFPDAQMYELWMTDATGYSDPTMRAAAQDFDMAGRIQGEGHQKKFMLQTLKNTDEFKKIAGDVATRSRYSLLRLIEDSHNYFYNEAGELHDPTIDPEAIDPNFLKITNNSDLLKHEGTFIIK
jgi:hypothetical protein